jgi:hypothetical protein
MNSRIIRVEPSLLAPVGLRDLPRWRGKPPTQGSRLRRGNAPARPHWDRRDGVRVRGTTTLYGDVPRSPWPAKDIVQDPGRLYRLRTGSGLPGRLQAGSGGSAQGADRDRTAPDRHGFAAIVYTTGAETFSLRAVEISTAAE